MKRVFTWQTDTSGVHHFRTVLPASAIDRSRFDWSWGVPPPDIHDYDVVVGQRLAGPNDGWQALCADPDVFAVYDIDDDLTRVDPANTIPYSIYSPPHVVAGTIANIRAADLVTVPTPAFAERMRQFNPNVAVLPICIPDDMPDWPARRGSEFTVGWAGSMFKAQDWPGIPEVLAEFLAQTLDAVVHTIGADYTRGMAGGRHRHTGWSTVDDYYRALDFHVGLAPLAVTPFNCLKCRTKAIEYGARGIPTVGTPIGEQATWIEHGTTGFLVETHTEWVEALHTLAQDDQLWARMSEAARGKARQATIGRNIHLWEAAFEGKPVW